MSRALPTRCSSRQTHHIAKTTRAIRDDPGRALPSWASPTMQTPKALDQTLVPPGTARPVLHRPRHRHGEGPRPHRHPPGTLPHHAAYLHQRTADRIGSLARLIRQAAIADGVPDLYAHMSSGSVRLYFGGKTAIGSSSTVISSWTGKLAFG